VKIGKHKFLNEFNKFANIFLINVCISFKYTFLACTGLAAQPANNQPEGIQIVIYIKMGYTYSHSCMDIEILHYTSITYI
jgi:hypothetical protein